MISLPPRLALLAGTSFPINDGGMFAVMIRELLNSGFVLPATTTYNHAGIPFSYPPLPFYVAAATVRLTGMAIPTVLRVVPFLANLATVIAFCWLARSLARSRSAAVMASLVFPLLPLAFKWQIMGGGLTRSLGLLFATLAIAAAHRLLVRGGTGRELVTTVLAAATVLCHPELALTCAAAFAVLWVIEGRHRRGAVSAAHVLLGVVVITAPWWGTIVARQGVAPFLNAAGTTTVSWADMGPLPLLSFVGDTYGSPLAVLAAVGFFFALSRRWLIPPVWLVAAFAVPHQGFRAATLPVALLAGSGLGDVILPAFREAAANGGPSPTLRRVAGPLLAALLLGHVLLFETYPYARQDPVVRTLSPAEREAMAWVAKTTPHDARFVVLTSAVTWAEDPVAEWFPALADRPSITTPQGSEWLADHVFQRRARMYEELKRCGGGDAACLVRWSARNRAPFDYVFVSKVIRGPTTPGPLVRALAGSPDFAVVYDSPGAVVMQCTASRESEVGERPE